jgi:hypothetical protein
MVKEWEEYARRQQPAKTRRWLAATQQLLPVLDAIEQSIVDVASTARSLEDGELAEALDALRKSYSSEASGILYQPSSFSPRVEMLVREARDRLAKLREEVRTKSKSELPPRAIIECLEVMIDRVDFHRSRPEGMSFIGHLCRVRPPTNQSAAGEGSGIILP